MIFLWNYTNTNFYKEINRKALKMLILGITILSLVILTLLIAYICYRISFYAPTRVADKDVEIHLPEGGQYDALHDGIQKSVDRMLAREYEPVWITTFDGHKLFARYYHVADGAPLQIQFHGYKSSAILDFSGGSYLAAKLGQNALVVDQRSHGQSEGTAITFGIKERKDVLAWIDYANERFGTDTKIILAGLSMGAATVLMSADLDLPDNVAGIFADCPYSAPADIIKKVCKTDMHLPAALLYPFVKLGAKLFAGFDIEESSAVSAVKEARIPILIIHGEGDYFVPTDMSRQIHASNPEKITLVTIPEAGHGLSYMVNPPKYEEAAVRFLMDVVS